MFFVLVYIYIIYREDFAQQYRKCGARSGSPQLCSFITDYRISGNFRGVLIFVIFVTIPRVTKFSTHEFSVGYCACASQPGEYGVNRTHVLKGSNSYRNGSLSLSTPHRVRRIGLRESRNLKPRKLILKTRAAFHENLHPRKLPAIR